VIQGRGQKEVFIEGLRLMRSGTLFIIIASILSFIAGVLLLFVLSWFILKYTGISIAPPIEIMPVVASHPGRVLEDFLERVLRSPRLLMMGLIIVIFLLASVILNLIGLWSRFIPGVRRLGSVNLEFSTASTLIGVGFFWGYLIILVALITGISALAYTISTRNLFGVVASAMGLLAGVLIGGLLVFIGTIGLIILVYRLHEHEKNPLYLASAVLFIVYIIASFISMAPYIGSFISIIDSALLFIAWILLYIALGESISRAEATPSQPTPPTPPIPPL
jgi:MFS family permease